LRPTQRNPSNQNTLVAFLLCTLKIPLQVFSFDH
jgi:hypothetical protein